MSEKSDLRHTPTKGLYGQITHTDLSSHDPKATREWCSTVLGWNFMAEFPTPAGEYHLFSYAEKAGGGFGQREKEKHLARPPLSMLPTQMRHSRKR